MKEQQILVKFMPKQESVQSQHNSYHLNYKENHSYESLSNLSNSCESGPQDSFDSLDSKKLHFTPSLMSYNISRYKKSFDVSQFYSESEQIRMDQFFDDQIILERRVEKKDVVFKKSCFTLQFTKHACQQIYKFTQNPCDQSFSIFLTRLFQVPVPIFNPDFEKAGGMNQVLEDFLYRQKHLYLIYSFDWNLCHLTFVCLLIIFWTQIDLVQFQEMSPQTKYKKQTVYKKSYIQNEHKKLRSNLSYISRLYISERSQEINTNQVTLVMIYYFLNLQKQYPFLEIVELCNTQNKLITDIKLFRRIKRKQKQFNSTCNKVIFESQLYKYEHGNKLIQSLDKTHTLFNLITSHNFVSTSLTKFYQLDEHQNSRKQYQRKKHAFCTWVMEIVINLCQTKSAESLHKSALYIVHLMGILKIMRQNNNIEGISYLAPVLANIKVLLPKVWFYAIKRRPEIEKKFNQYSEYLLKKHSRMNELGENGAILWGQTIYQLTEKMGKQVTKHTIVLEEHQAFYDQFLKDLIYFRNKVQQNYEEQIQNYNRDRQIGSSFNMYLLDNYIPRTYRDHDDETHWKILQIKAKKVNQQIQNSIYIDIIDYCFIGSTYRYSRIDI